MADMNQSIRDVRPREASFRFGRFGNTFPVLPGTDWSPDGVTEQVGSPQRIANVRIGRIGGTIPVWPNINGSLDGATVSVAATQDISTSINVRHGIRIGGTIPLPPRIDREVQEQYVPAVIGN